MYIQCGGLWMYIQWGRVWVYIQCGGVWMSVVSVGRSAVSLSVCCVLSSDLQVGLQFDPAPLGLPAQLTLVGFLQQVDVLLTERLPTILWLHLPNHT